MLSTTPLLLHDNASAQRALVTKAALRDCGFEKLSHPPYSTKHSDSERGNPLPPHGSD